MDIETVQDLLADALQSDLENGVGWLNDIAHEKFANDYPETAKAISTIMSYCEDS